MPWYARYPCASLRASTLISEIRALRVARLVRGLWFAHQPGNKKITEMPRHSHYDPMPDLDAVRFRLKYMRGRLGLSQEDTAREMGVPPRTFQSWENGEVITAESNYERLAEFYSRKLGEEINCNVILYGTPERPLPESKSHNSADLLAMELRLRREMDRRISALRAELLQDIAPHVVKPLGRIDIQQGGSSQ